MQVGGDLLHSLFHVSLKEGTVRKKRRNVRHEKASGGFAGVSELNPMLLACCLPLLWPSSCIHTLSLSPFPSSLPL